MKRFHMWRSRAAGTSRSERTEFLADGRRLEVFRFYAIWLCSHGWCIWWLSRFASSFPVFCFFNDSDPRKLPADQSFAWFLTLVDLPVLLHRSPHIFVIFTRKFVRFSIIKLKYLSHHRRDHECSASSVSIYSSLAAVCVQLSAKRIRDSISNVTQAAPFHTQERERERSVHGDGSSLPFNFVHSTFSTETCERYALQDGI